ncbi:MAG: tetratricopeptide repeat protein [Phycisphaeraceae bacterium]|nr:tetratricopeptide repeat protein [Phycisphaeraceae bacterium]
MSYLPAMTAGFIWDDDAYVTDNQVLRSADGLAQIWLNPQATPQYYPLVHTTYWLEYRLWGLWPAGYHVVNILLHALSAVLVWRILRRLGLAPTVAWLAAAIFALHPVHAESVAWVTERKNVLSLCFYLWAAWAYFHFDPPQPDEKPKPRPWPWFALAGTCFVLALLSKTVTASLPAALLLIYWWKRSRISWPTFWPLLPWLVVGISFGQATAWLEKFRVGTAVAALSAEFDFSWPQRLLIAGQAVWFYAWKLLWPTDLMFIYPRWTIRADAWRLWLYPAAGLAVVAALWSLRQRLGRGPLAAVLFFAGTLFPALGFVDVFPFRYAFVADHFQYHASLGLIVLAAACWQFVRAPLERAHPLIPAVSAAVLLSVLGALTFAHTRIYRDQETLWRDTLAKDDSIWMAHHNLAAILASQGQWAQALSHYQKSLAYKPGDPLIQNNIAGTLAALGKMPQAIALLTQMEASGQAIPPTYTLLARLYLADGKPQEAIAPARKAVALYAQDDDALRTLGQALWAVGQTQEAEARLRQAVAVNPRQGLNCLRLGIVLFKQRKIAEATPCLTQAAQLRDHDPSAYHYLGLALATQGRLDQAAAALSKAADLSPQDPLAWYLLAQVQADAGRIEPARQAAAKALDIAQKAGQNELANEIQASLTQWENPFRHESDDHDAP